MKRPTMVFNFLLHLGYFLWGHTPAEFDCLLPSRGPRNDDGSRPPEVTRPKTPTNSFIPDRPHPGQGQSPDSVREVFLANYAATLLMFQYLFHKLLEYMLAKAITASALSLSHLIPAPLSRLVRQPQNDSVGPEPTS